MKNLFLFTLVVLLFSNCNKAETCSGKIACTELFAYITVDVIAAPLTPSPALDSFATKRINDGKVVLNNSEMLMESPVIFSDSEMFETSVKGEEFLFEAFKNGQKVISEKYVIKHDCCHIIKVSGKDTINL